MHAPLSSSPLRVRSNQRLEKKRKTTTFTIIHTPSTPSQSHSPPKPTDFIQGPGCFQSRFRSRPRSRRPSVQANPPGPPLSPFIVVVAAPTSQSLILSDPGPREQKRLTRFPCLLPSWLWLLVLNLFFVSPLRPSFWLHCRLSNPREFNFDISTSLAHPIIHSPFRSAIRCASQKKTVPERSIGCPLFALLLSLHRN